MKKAEAKSILTALDIRLSCNPHSKKVNMTAALMTDDPNPVKKAKNQIKHKMIGL